MRLTEYENRTAPSPKTHFAELLESADPLEKIMSRLGSVEILPEEKPYQDRLKWAGYKARTLLRLGKEGQFIYDPHTSSAPNQLRPPTGDLSLFKTMLRLCLTSKPSDIHSRINTSRQADPETAVRQERDIVTMGILRRIISLPEYREYLKDALEKDDHKIGLLHSLIYHEANGEQKEDKPPLPNVLIIAHKGKPATNSFLSKALRKDSPLKDLLRENVTKVENVLDAALIAVAWPYLGAAVLGEEALSTKKIGNVHVADYHDCTERGIQNLVEKHHPKYTFISGTLTYDVASLPRLTEQSRQNGSRVVLGGPITSLDPEVLLQKTTADIFIGEIEQAMGFVLDILEKARPEERFIFIRGNEHMTEPRIIRKGPNLNLVVLPVAHRVNIASYYDMNSQERGRLARRLQIEKQMEPTINIGARQFENSIYSTKQLDISRGCPANCPMCSTVPAQGMTMRRKPIAELELEIKAAETPFMIAVDQNLGALGRNEEGDTWKNWMLSFFQMLKKEGKTLACQTELEFFDRVNQPGFEDIRRILPEVMVAALAGLEGENKLRGINSKNPADYKTIIDAIHKMGILLLGTVIADIPESALLKGETEEKVQPKTAEEYIKWFNRLRYFVPITFPFQNIPRRHLFEKTDEDPMVKYEHINTSETEIMADRINIEAHSLRKILSRWNDMRGFHIRRQLLGLIISLGFWGIYKAGAQAPKTVFEMFSAQDRSNPRL